MQFNTAMPDQPIINIDTANELSPETRAILEQTPEQTVLTEGEQPTQSGSSLRIPVLSMPVPAARDG